MIQVTEKQSCIGCHACYNVCPQKCIEMIADTEGFLYPQADNTLCSNCGLCDKVCPMNIELPDGEKPKAYAAWNKNEAVRKDSSSGGIFSVIASDVLKKGGVVFGAAFDDTMTLRHMYAQNEEECSKFRGSKYLQSIIGNTYKEATRFLKQGRSVLFSGTPCQIAGLYSYLGKDYDNLLTIDLVCHGVPSPKVFEIYKVFLENKYCAKTRKIAFRHKNYGWKLYSVSLSFDNDTEYREVFIKDPFMKGFLKNIYLRPSCHVCKFSRLPRVADISLADFWGVSSHHPEWDDDMGTSLVLTQTEKGEKALKACTDKIHIFDAPLDKAIASNSSICCSAVPNKKRTAFFKNLDTMPFEKLQKKYCSDTVFESIYRKCTSLSLVRRGLKVIKKILYFMRVQTLKF